MTNLAGRNVVLLKVSPENIENATREISDMPNVTGVWPILGSYDLLVSTGYTDYDTLRQFAERIRARPYCYECKVHPSFTDWTREGAKEMPVKGWVFIDTADFDSTFQGLQRIENVNWVISTSGDYNVIAYIGVDGFKEYGHVLRKNVHTLPGIRKTETYTNPPE